MPIKPRGRTGFPAPQEPTSYGASGLRGAVAPVRDIGRPADAMAAAGADVGRVAAQIFAEDRDREIRTRLLEVDIARRQADRDVLDGYLQLQGKNAVDGREKAMAAIAANGKTSRGDIKDETVANLWKEQDQALTNAAVGQLDSHYRAENTRWQVDTLQSRRDLLISTVERVAFSNDGDSRGRLSDEAVRTRSAYLGTIAELGQTLGWSPETIEAQQRAADTKAYGQVAESLLRQDRFGEASTVLQHYGDRIDVGTRDLLAERARDGAARQAAAQQTAQLATFSQDWAMKAADVARENGGTIEQQRSYAVQTAEYSFRGGKLDGEQLDEVLKRLDRHFKHRDQEEATTDQQTIVAAQRFLEENKLQTLADSPKLYEQVKQRGLLPGLREFEKNGRFATDPDVYAQVRSLTDDDLRRRNPARLWVTLRPWLANGDLDDVMSRQARALGTADGKVLRAINLSDRLEDAARSIGILPTNPTERLRGDQQARWDAWRQRTDAELVEWQKGTLKREATPEEYQKQLDVMKADYVERVRPGLVWNSVDRFALSRLSPAERRLDTSVVVGGERVDLKRLPESAWSQAAAFLAEKGIQPTAQNIVERWVAIGRPGDLQVGR